MAESLFQKDKRLKSRKYASNVRVLNAGDLNDGTNFITITIEGFKAPADGI